MVEAFLSASFKPLSSSTPGKPSFWELKKKDKKRKKKEKRKKNRRGRGLSFGLTHSKPLSSSTPGATGRTRASRPIGAKKRPFGGITGDRGVDVTSHLCLRPPGNPGAQPPPNDRHSTPNATRPRNLIPPPSTLCHHHYTHCPEKLARIVNGEKEKDSKEVFS